MDERGYIDQALTDAYMQDDMARRTKKLLLLAICCASALAILSIAMVV
jgi:hypothetical protein